MVNWKRWKLLGVGFGLLILYFIVTWLIFPRLGINIPENFYPIVWPLIIIAAIGIGISGLIPYNLGKIFRQISYITLFVLFLILQLAIFKTVFGTYRPPEVSLQQCTTLFGTKEKPTEVWDAIGVWSCVTAGYFPATYSDLGWTVFFIFYLLLPFAFIWALLYGLMKGIKLGDLFGGFADTGTTLLSFIIAMYAARQLFGFFLLDFYGYGAWGLAGVFGAALFVMALRNIIEKWFKLEEIAREIRKAQELESEMEKDQIPITRKMLEKIERSSPQTQQMAIRGLQDPNTLAYKEYISPLSEARRDAVLRAIRANLDNPKKAIEEAKKALE